MVKENTHLFAADRIIHDLRDTDMRAVIGEHRGAYDLGSIIPDSFYYSPRASVREVSDLLHGKKGEHTGKIVFDVLEGLGGKRDNGDNGDLAFVLGYLTHCAMDSTFHPFIYYLTGNHRDGTVTKDDSRYYHFHYETYLDHKWNGSLYLDRIIRTDTLGHLSFPYLISKRTGIRESDASEAVEAQILMNRMLRTAAPYAAVRALNRLGVMGRSSLGLFYRNLRYEREKLDGRIDYGDIITGEPLSTTPEELVEDAMDAALPMMTAAFDFYHGRIDKRKLAEAIPGRSLATGKAGVSASDIRYTKYHNP